MAKQIKVGTFPMGRINVDLYALPNGDGGYFYCAPDNHSPPRIKVGLKGYEWPRVVSVLLHEATELAMSLRGLRYEKTGELGDHSTYTFLFTHNDFSYLCQDVADFITPAIPLLATIYNKHAK